MALTPSLTKQSLDALSAPLCCICSQSKDRNRAFCNECYFALPQPLRMGLYKAFSEGYVDAWDEAREWLKINNKEKK